MDDQEQIAFLHQRVQELMARERDLSMALCQAPRPEDDAPQAYKEWFWLVRHKAIHGYENPRRLGPDPYASTMLPRKHGG